MTADAVLPCATGHHECDGTELCAPLCCRDTTEETTK